MCGRERGMKQSGIKNRNTDVNGASEKKPSWDYYQQ